MDDSKNKEKYSLYQNLLQGFTVILENFEKTDTSNPNLINTLTELLHQNLNKEKNLTEQDKIFLIERPFKRYNSMELLNLRDTKYYSFVDSIRVCYIKEPKLIKFLLANQGKELSDISLLYEGFTNEYLNNLFLLIDYLNAIKRIKNSKCTDSKYEEDGPIPVEFCYLLNLKKYINTDKEYETKFSQIESTIDIVCKKIKHFIKFFHISKIEKTKEFLKMRMNIITNSTIHLSVDPDTYEIICKITSSKKNITLDEFKEIRDYLILPEDNGFFNNLFRDVNELINTINKIVNIGYFSENLNIWLNINDQSVTVKDHENMTLDLLIKKYNKLYDEFRQKIINKYQSNYFFTFVYGKLFNVIIKNLKNLNKKTTLDPEFLNFCRYITTNINFKLDKKLQFTPVENEIDGIIVNVENFLNRICGSHQDLLTKYNKNKTEKFGLHYTIKSSTILEKTILETFFKFTNQLPRYHSIIFCSENTTEFELISFLHRCIFCPNKNLFLIVTPENLRPEIYDSIFMKYMTMFIREIQKNKTLIIIITQSDDKDLMDNFKDIKAEKLKDSILIYEEPIAHFFNHLEIVFSENLSGIGKTSYIIRKIYGSQFQDKNKDKMIYFPVGGDIDYEEIINRLNKLDYNKIPGASFHLDLYETTDMDKMRTFLFSFIINQIFCYKEKIFFFDGLKKIYIEIPYNFTNLIEEYPLLEYLPNKTSLTTEELPPLLLDVSKNSANIQIVANFLKQMEENDLKTSDLVPDRKRSKSSNAKEIKNLSQSICQQILSKYTGFLGVGYHQLSSFINILAYQLKQFAQNESFFIESLTQEQINADYKTKVIENLIYLAVCLSKSAFENLLKEQKQTENMKKVYNKDELIKIGMAKLENSINVLTFDKIGYNNLLFFDSNPKTFTIITKSQRSSNTYKELRDLWNVMNNNEENSVEVDLNDYESMNQDDYFADIKKILSVNISPRELKKLKGEYSFTLDNLIRIVIIMIKLKSGVPVLMMGERGCGKTYLFKFICDLHKFKRFIFNVNSSTSDKDIIDFMTTKVLPSAEVDKEEEIWILFRRINTCNSMSLLSEILINRTYKGKQIPENVYIISTCYPYRVQESKVDRKNSSSSTSANTESSVNPENKDILSKLIYKLYPMPHSLLHFVYDFGTITRDTMRKYIVNKVKNSINELFIGQRQLIESQMMGIELIIMLISDTVITSQEYLNERNDQSNANLKQVDQFMKYFVFFVNFIKNKNMDNLLMNCMNNVCIFVDNFEKLQTQMNICLRSLLLSLYMNYYVKINKQEDRDKYLESIIHKKMLVNNFMQMINNEQDYLVNQLEVGEEFKSIPYLKENIFALFIAVNTNTPLIIYGKPEFNLNLIYIFLSNGMKGKKSKSVFFKKYPCLTYFNYQCTENTTKYDINKIFSDQEKEMNILLEKNESSHPNNFSSNMASSKAGKNDKEHTPVVQRNNILLIVLNELGNLKDENVMQFLNDKLEDIILENSDSIINPISPNSIAFLGLSVSDIDYLQYSQSLIIHIFDMPQYLINESAINIPQSYNESLSKYRKFFMILSSTYYKYTKTNFEINFHGPLDYYYLIKMTTKHILEYIKNSREADYWLNANELYSIGVESIDQSFGGLPDNLKEIKEIFNAEFSKVYPNFRVPDKFSEVTFLQNLDGNLNSSNNKYLLIFLSASLENNIMEYLEKKYTLFDGGEMMKKISENNANRLLSNKESKNEEIVQSFLKKILIKLQYNLEKDEVIIFKNLKNLYNCFTELFNQTYLYLQNNIANINYSVYRTQKLVIDTETNTKFLILVNENELKNQNYQFINAFEKYSINYKSLLPNDLVNFVNEVYHVYKQLFLVSNEELSIYKRPYIYIEKENLNSIVYFFEKEYRYFSKDKLMQTKYSQNIYMDKILDLISSTLSQEMIVSMRLSSFYKNATPKEASIVEKLFEFYKNNQYFNIQNFIDNIQDNREAIIYTHHDFVKDNLSMLSDKDYEKIMVNLDDNPATPNANLFDTIISKTNHSLLNFFKNINRDICFIMINKYNIKTIKQILGLIKDLNIQFNNSKKSIIMLVYLKENISFSTIPFTYKYKQIYIDNLNGNIFKFDTLENVFISTTKKLVEMKEEELKDKTLGLLNNFYLNYSIDLNLTNHEQAKIMLLKVIRQDNLKKVFTDIINEHLKNIKKNFVNDFIKIGDEINKSELSFFECYQPYQMDIYLNELMKILYNCITYQIFPNINSTEEITANLFASVYDSMMKDTIRLEKSNSNYKLKKCEKFSKIMSDIIFTNITLINSLFEEIKINLEIISKTANINKLFSTKNLCYMESISDEKAINYSNYYNISSMINQIMTRIDTELTDNYLYVALNNTEYSKNTIIFEGIITDFFDYYLVDNNFYDSKSIYSKGYQKESENKFFKVLKDFFQVLIDKFIPTLYSLTCREVLLNIYSFFYVHKECINILLKLFIVFYNIFDSQKDTPKLDLNTIKNLTVKEDKENENQSTSPPRTYLLFQGILDILMGTYCQNYSHFFDTLKENDVNSIQLFLNQMKNIELLARKLENYINLNSDNLIQFELLNEFLFVLLQSKINFDQYKINIELLFTYNKGDMRSIMDYKLKTGTEESDVIDGLKQHLNLEIDLIETNFKNNINYNKMINKLFLGKLKYRVEPYKKILIDKICEDNKYINICLPTLKEIIFSSELSLNAKNSSTVITNIFEKIKSISLLDILNEKISKNKFFKITLIHLFSLKFESSLKTNSFYLFPESFEILVKAFNLTNDNKNNLQTVVAISYIKSYLNNNINYLIKKNNDKLLQDFFAKFQSSCLNNTDLTLYNEILNYFLKVYYQYFGSLDLILNNEFIKRNANNFKSFQNFNELTKRKVSLIKNLFFYDLDQNDTNIAYLDSLYEANFDVKSKNENSNEEIDPKDRFSSSSSLNFLFNYISNRMNSILKSQFLKSNVKMFFDKTLTNNKGLIKFYGFMFNDKIDLSKEYLFYCLKFAYICLNTMITESWFFKIFSKDVKDIINDSYIPGTETDDYLKDSIREIKNIFVNLDENTISPAIYSCKCGYFYQIDDYGLPNTTRICPRCKKILGGKNYSIGQESNDSRIFKTKIHQEFVLSQLDKAEKHIPSLTLDQLSDTLSNMQIDHKGLSKEKFSENLTCKGMTPLTNALLNLFINSILFYSSMINNVNLVDEPTLKSSWDLSAKYLKGLNIDIYIFLNIIYDYIPGYTQLCERFDTIEKKREFEKDFKDNIVEPCIKEYSDKKKKYIEFKGKLLKKVGDCSILDELENIEVKEDSSQYTYPEEFIIEKIPDFEDMKQKLNVIPNYLSKYPVTSNYLFNEKYNLYELKKIPFLNKLENLLIKKFNFAISKEKAVSKVNIDNLFLRLKNFTKYSDYYNEIITSFNTNYEYFIKSNLPLVNFKPSQELDKEIKFETKTYATYLNNSGIQECALLNSMYSRLIDLQNSYFVSIYDCTKEDKDQKPQETYVNIFKDYIEENKISIQKAEDVDILEDIYSKEITGKIQDSLSYYSFKECLSGDDNKVNYLKINDIGYNFDLIEEVLTNTIFAGKKKFSSEQEIYQFVNKGFDMKNSILISKYLYVYAKQQFILDNEKKGQLELSSILTPQNLLVYTKRIFNTIDKKNMSPDTPVKDVISTKPGLFNGLSKKITNFYNNCPFLILGNMMSFFEYYEMQHIDVYINYLNVNFKEPLNENLKKIIIKKFNDLPASDRAALNNAVIKYIIRYLYYEDEVLSNPSITLLYEKNVIDELFKKEDIWYAFGQKEKQVEIILKLKKSIKNQFSGVNILMKKIVPFYRVLNNQE